MTKHASFKDFWDVWKYADWSIVFLRISVTLFKDRSDICQFKDCWKFRLINWNIKTGMKNICENISIFLSKSWWDIWILTGLILQCIQFQDVTPSAFFQIFISSISMLHLFYEENKSGLSMDELQYGLFSQKKNLSRDYLP